MTTHPTTPALIFTLLAASGVAVVRAATPLPAWDGDPGSTRQGYLFDTGSLSPTANILQNSYGVPTANLTLGAFTSGWQDPNAPYTNPGADGDGAWDLGISGVIQVTVPIALAPADPGTYYRVDFQVWAVAYKGITALPAFEADGPGPCQQRCARRNRPRIPQRLVARPHLDRPHRQPHHPGHRQLPHCRT